MSEEEIEAALATERLKNAEAALAIAAEALEIFAGVYNPERVCPYPPYDPRHGPSRPDCSHHYDEMQVTFEQQAQINTALIIARDALAAARAGRVDRGAADRLRAEAEAMLEMEEVARKNARQGKHCAGNLCVPCQLACALARLDAARAGEVPQRKRRGGVGGR